MQGRNEWGRHALIRELSLMRSLKEFPIKDRWVNPSPNEWGHHVILPLRGQWMWVCENIYIINQGSPCPLVTLNPFGKRVRLTCWGRRAGRRGRRMIWRCRKWVWSKTWVCVLEYFASSRYNIFEQDTQCKGSKALSPLVSCIFRLLSTNRFKFCRKSEIPQLHLLIVEYILPFTSRFTW